MADVPGQIELGPVIPQLGRLRAETVLVQEIVPPVTFVMVNV